MENLNDYIDLEDFALKGKIPSKKSKYLIKVDKKKYKVEFEIITGRQILEIAEKLPVENFQLRQKFKGGTVKKIALTDKVDLTEPGVEKFMTIPLDQMEG